MSYQVWIHTSYLHYSYKSKAPHIPRFTSMSLPLSSPGFYQQMAHRVRSVQGPRQGGQGWDTFLRYADHFQGLRTYSHPYPSRGWLEMEKIDLSQRSHTSIL